MQAISFLLASVMLPMDATAADPYYNEVYCTPHCRTLDEYACPGVFYQSEVQLLHNIFERMEQAEGLSLLGRRIRVCTTANTVTLRGRVATAVEKKWLLTVARSEAAGAFRVIDDISITP